MFHYILRYNEALTQKTIAQCEGGHTLTPTLEMQISATIWRRKFLMRRPSFWRLIVFHKILSNYSTMPWNTELFSLLFPLRLLGILSGTDDATVNNGESVTCWWPEVLALDCRLWTDHENFFSFFTEFCISFSDSKPNLVFRPIQNILHN